MKSQDIRKKLKDGAHTIGTWLQIPHPSVAEVLGQSRYDWVAVDLEHGSISTDNLPDLFRAISLGGALPFARVAQGASKDLKAALDAGAKGIIVPMIESSEQLDQSIKFMQYPPQGYRGVGFSRANLFGRNFEQYVKSINEELTIVAQIEHIKAVNDIDKILSHPRLDAIMVGPYDLSASMGLTAQFDHPDFLKALEKISESCKKHKIPAGIHVVTPSVDDLKAKIKSGYKFIAYGIDAVFLHTAAKLPEEF